MESTSRRLQYGVQNAMPFLLLLFIIFACGVMAMTFRQALPPLFCAWACVYYWALFQPMRMRYVELFLAGLFQDVLLGFPLGMSSLCFVMIRVAVGTLRRMMSVKQFGVTWGGFALLSFGMGLVTLAVYHVVRHQPLGAIWVQLFYGVAVTCVSYPLVHWLSNKIYSRLPQQALRGLA